MITFELYRFLNRHLTVSQIGTWSVVLASAAASRVLDFGLGGGVVKFVARHMGSEARDYAAATVQMALGGMLILFGLAALLLFPLLSTGLALLIKDAASLLEARTLLPYALVTLIVSALSSVALSALDGCQRMDLRAVVVTSGSVAQLVSAYFAVPALGLPGLAAAQVIQSVFILLFSLALLFRVIGTSLNKFTGWSTPRLKELIAYGSGFQVAAIGHLFFEPVVKVVLTRYSTLEFTGYYEMANQLVIQFRNLLVSAYQALVPYVAAADRSNQELRNLYRTSYRLLFFFCCLGFGTFGLFLPLTLQFWIGHHSHAFVSVAEISLLGWTLNTLNVPSYFIFLGIGQLKWPVVSHLIMGLLAAGFGVLFGHWFGGFGVLSAVMTVLVFASHIVTIAYHREFSIPLTDLFPRESITLALWAFLGTASIFAMTPSSHRTFGMATMIAMCGFSAVLVFYSLRNSNMDESLTLLRELRRTMGGGLSGA